MSDLESDVKVELGSGHGNSDQGSKQQRVHLQSVSARGGWVG